MLITSIISISHNVFLFLHAKLKHITFCRLLMFQYEGSILSSAGRKESRSDTELHSRQIYFRFTNQACNPLTGQKVVLSRYPVDTARTVSKFRHTTDKAYSVKKKKLTLFASLLNLSQFYTYCLPSIEYAPLITLVTVLYISGT